MKYSLRSLMIVGMLAPQLLAAAYFLALLLRPVIVQALLVYVSVLFLGAIATLMVHIHRSNRDKI